MANLVVQYGTWPLHGVYMHLSKGTRIVCLGRQFPYIYPPPSDAHRLIDRGPLFKISWHV